MGKPKGKEGGAEDERERERQYKGQCESIGSGPETLLDSCNKNWVASTTVFQDTWLVALSAFHGL